MTPKRHHFLCTKAAKQGLWTSATHTPLASAGRLAMTTMAMVTATNCISCHPLHPTVECRIPPRSAPSGTMRQQKQARAVCSLLQQKMPGNKMRGALRKAEAPQDSAAAPTSVESSSLTAEAPPAEGSRIGSIIGSVFSALSPSSEPPPPAQAAGGSTGTRGVSPSAAGIAAQGAPLSPEAHARPTPKWDKLRAATLQIPASINDGQSPRSNDPHEEM